MTKAIHLTALFWTSTLLAQVAQRYGAAMRAGKIQPMLLVFPNGLPMGMWCEWKDSSVRLETMFIEELIAHIDRQLPGIPHNPNLVLNALGDDNWSFYRQDLNSAAFRWFSR